MAIVCLLRMMQEEKWNFFCKTVRLVIAVLCHFFIMLVLYVALGESNN
jgi:hypothetical protein